MARKAHLTLDTPDIFALKTTYHEMLVTLIKNIPPAQRAWNPERKVWLIHTTHYGYILTVLQQLHYDTTDEVKEQLRGTVQQTPPGIWLLASHANAGQFQTHCPVCSNAQQLACYTVYADITHTIRLQFYSGVCEHLWELCLQVSEGRLLSWTDIIRTPLRAPENDADADEPWETTSADGTQPPSHLHNALEARRSRLQGEDFESWFERAMDDEDDWGESGSP
ncbi:MAG: hypothetical protein V3U27_01220 [Candidatus Tectomicrobia bacterium]